MSRATIVPSPDRQFLLVVQCLYSPGNHHRSVVCSGTNEYESHHAQVNRLVAGKSREAAQIHVICEVGRHHGERLWQQHAGKILVVKTERAVVAVLHVGASHHPVTALSLAFENHAVDHHARWRRTCVKLAAEENALPGELGGRPKKKRSERYLQIRNHVLFISSERNRVNLTERITGQIGKFSAGVDIEAARLAV